MQYDISQIVHDFSDVKQDTKDYKHDYSKVEFVIPDNEHEFADVELSLGNVEPNSVGGEHNFDELELDISVIANDFYHFGDNRYDFNVYNQ